MNSLHMLEVLKLLLLVFAKQELNVFCETWGITISKMDCTVSSSHFELFLAVCLWVCWMVRGINFHLIRTLFLLESVTLSGTGQQLLCPSEPPLKPSIPQGCLFKYRGIGVIVSMTSSHAAKTSWWFWWLWILFYIVQKAWVQRSRFDLFFEWGLFSFSAGDL